MMWTLISINWTGQAFSNEQQMILRNVAAQHLRQDRKDPVVYFTHDLCEGSITKGKEGSFGTFSGTFFHADLGTIKGERWTCDFLLPRGTEHILLDDKSVAVSARPLSTGGVGVQTIDVGKTHIEPAASHTVH